MLDRVPLRQTIELPKLARPGKKKDEKKEEGRSDEVLARSARAFAV